MTSQTVLRYLFGSAGAIRRVAVSSASLPLGVALVLLTAIARNYDQTPITETPLWLFGPLLFSVFSGTWLFFVLYDRCIKRRIAVEDRPRVLGQWRSFMGLFWMTAPIAWLYAIPVERFLDPMNVARANVALLGVVSLWRVALMSRVVSVVNTVPFPRALGWVMVAASLEVIFVTTLGVLFGALFSADFSEQILASMAGMRNAPDESVLLSALVFARRGAGIALAATLILLAVFRFKGGASPFPSTARERMPWAGLALVTAVWVLIAVPAQREQQRFTQHAGLVSQAQYSGALAYLSAHERTDFPASRRLEPNPYELRVWRDLPPTVALLTPDTPAWIRETYLSHLAATFLHDRSGYRSMDDVAAMYAAIERLPEGKEWLRANENALAAQGIAIGGADDDLDDDSYGGDHEHGDGHDVAGDDEDDDLNEHANDDPAAGGRVAGGGIVRFGEDMDAHLRELVHADGGYGPAGDARDAEALTSVLASLRALGMAEANVAKLARR